METDVIIEEQDFQTGGVAVVSTAHAVHDTYTAYLPALLPLLIEKFSLTNTAAGLLSVFMQIPSLLQPLIGHIADRKNLKMLIILTPATTGVAMSLLGVAPGYGFLVILLLLAGISSAALHAVGPVVGSMMSGSKLGKGMSFWMVAGELGRALGPLIMVSVVGLLSLEKLPWLMIFGLGASVFLYSKLNGITTLPKKEPTKIHWKTALRDMSKVMIPVTFIILARSMMLSSLTIYLPIFMTDQGASLWVAGASLTILQVSGMVGAFLAGGLSDRFGRRLMLIISYVATPILMYLFIQSKNAMQIPLLILLGFFAVSVVPVIMAIVLENANENRSFANGVYMAVSFIIQALATLLVGIISDAVNLQVTFTISAGLVFLGLPFILMLPKSTKNE